MSVGGNSGNTIRAQDDWLGRDDAAMRDSERMFKALMESAMSPHQGENHSQGHANR
jgi:hypothetical protein